MKKIRRVLVTLGLGAALAFGASACEAHDTIYHCANVDTYLSAAYNVNLYVSQGGRHGNTDFCTINFSSSGNYFQTCEVNIHTEQGVCY